MYICLDCGALFSDTRKYIERHGLDSPPYEEIIGCPSCGGAYVEAIQCDICGNYIVDDYFETKEGRIYCADCCGYKYIDDLME